MNILKRDKNMKKLFLLASALILIGVYMNIGNTSISTASERKIIYDGYDGSVYDIIPAIRVMTYNIHRGINKENKLDLDGIAEAIKSSGAEIIALQEVERFSVRTRFQDQIQYIAEKLSMQYAYGKSLNILNGQYGNAMLSKYPIEEYEVIGLPYEGEKRTLLRARLNVLGNDIIFYNTHLGLNESERALQLEEIAELAAKDKNILLMGDFNSKVDKLGTIIENFKDCASIDKDNSRATFEKDGLIERIDYIFVSNNFRVKEYDVLESNASDHYPVVSTIELKD
jgi:endonuclease/exonuclease/phosphatase family metal-dependent hydrolase